MFNFLALLQLAVAAYLIVGAITGKNKVFTSRFIKEEKKDVYKKWMRILFGVAGGLLATLSGVNITASLLPQESALWGTLSVASTVLGIAVLTALLAMFVLNQCVQDREKKNQPVRHVAPRAAFYFEDEEEKKK